jgi:tRNA pseudouridine32 synthase/23S rRNA pseudouridine746 synthase
MKIFKGKVSRHFTRKCSLGEACLKLSPLSLEQISEASSKGAIWIKRGGQRKTLRIRSVDELVAPDDEILIYFDAKVLAVPELKNLRCLYEDKNYGVWVKPAGVVAQGSQSGDHASVLRYVEKVKGKEVYLVHRLDRETDGLILVAYHAKAAALLSNLFKEHLIKKTYEAIVLGRLPQGLTQEIMIPLDEKEAITNFEVLASNDQQSLLRLTIQTGRLHQIRRHLDLIGHPVIGDPQYGRGNKNRSGLKLKAVELCFRDPWSNQEKTFNHFDSLSL